MSFLSYAIILAGGYGTRFWPVSRRAKPKQFLQLTGRESLLQQTYRRVAQLFARERIYVVGNAEHRSLLRRQLPCLPGANLLLEPVGRNTAAAIALAAAQIREHYFQEHRSYLPEPLLAVFPADHAIRQETKLGKLVLAALTVMTKTNVVVTLGIRPTHAHSGYGYIQVGRKILAIGGQSVYLARRFTEKPDARTAARFLRSGHYLWNSGIFFFRFHAFVRLLYDYLRPTYNAYMALFPSHGPREFRRLVNRRYPRLPNISVDYALAEPAAADGELCVIPADIGWSDLGSWSALADWLGPKHGSGRFSLDARGNLIHAPGKFAAAIGAENLIVVETPDALLLCRRDCAQDVGKVVHYLEKKRLRRWL